MNPQNTIAKGPDDGATARVLSVLNLIAGIWLFLSTWLFGLPNGSAAMWNSAVFGVIVVILAIVHLSDLRQTWVSWLNALVGLWTLISPWVYNYSGNQGMTWSSVITGIVVVVLSVWTASVSPRLVTR